MGRDRVWAGRGETESCLSCQAGREGEDSFRILQGTERCTGQQASGKGSGEPRSPPPSFPPQCQRAGIGKSEGGGCVQGQTPVLSSPFPYNVLVLTEGREGKSWVVLNACICRDQGYLSSLSLPTAARMVRGGSQAWQGKNVDPSVLRIPVF